MAPSVIGVLDKGELLWTVDDHVSPAIYYTDREMKDYLAADRALPWGSGGKEEWELKDTVRKEVERQRAELAPGTLEATALSSPFTPEQLLKDETWWEEAVKPALDEKIAGEDDNKRLHFYSGMSSQLPNKIHSYAWGDSQQGKSYIQRTIAREIFSSILIEVSSQSGKAAYAQCKERGKDYYAHKLLLIDEFKDLSDEAQAFFKQMMSAGQDRLTNVTQDINRKSDCQEIEGVPTVWTSSAEVVEDAGSQKMNRPFKTNIDETQAQSDRVEAFQRVEEMFGSLRPMVNGTPSRIPLARAVVELIMQEKDVEVLNPFANFIKLKDNSKRNKRPQLRALVQAVAYANRFTRINFEVDGKKYLLANLKDNHTAIDIWLASEDRQRYGVPDSYMKVFGLLHEPPLGLTVDEVTERYNLASPKRQISSATVYNRLKYLCQKDLTSSYSPELTEKDNRETDKRGRPKLLYVRLSHFSTYSTFDRDVKIEGVDRDKLATELEAYKSIFPLFHLETQRIVSRLMGEKGEEG